MHEQFLTDYSEWNFLTTSDEDYESMATFWNLESTGGLLSHYGRHYGVT